MGFDKITWTLTPEQMADIRKIGTCATCKLAVCVSPRIKERHPEMGCRSWSSKPEPNKGQNAMAVKKKTTKQPPGHNLKAAICAQVDELLTNHIKEILEWIDTSEVKKQNVSFGVLIDCAESEPKVEVSIRFSQSITDSRTVQLDNPDQGTFEQITEEATEETNKRKEKNLAKLNGRGRKKKPETDEEPPRVVAGEQPETT